MGNSADRGAAPLGNITSTVQQSVSVSMYQPDYYAEIDGRLVDVNTGVHNVDIAGTRLELIPDPWRYIIGEMIKPRLVEYVAALKIYELGGRHYVGGCQNASNVHLPNNASFKNGVMFVGGKMWATKVDFEAASRIGEDRRHYFVCMAVGSKLIICTCIKNPFL